MADPDAAAPGLFVARAMKCLVALFALTSTSVRADNCKPIADALVKIATVPNHAVIMSRTLGTFETVHTQNALYESFQGKWKQLPYNDAEDASRKANAFQDTKVDCTLRGAETIGDQAVQHYAATEHLKGGAVFDEFWISSASGLILKSSLTFSKDDITTTYDYANIKAPL